MMGRSRLFNSSKKLMARWSIWQQCLKRWCYCVPWQHFPRTVAPTLIAKTPFRCGKKRSVVTFSWQFCTYLTARLWSRWFLWSLGLEPNIWRKIRHMSVVSIRPDIADILLVIFSCPTDQGLESGTRAGLGTIPLWSTHGSTSFPGQGCSWELVCDSWLVYLLYLLTC